MAQTLAMPVFFPIHCDQGKRKRRGHDASPRCYFLLEDVRPQGGVEILNNKRVEYSLQYIHGIERMRARQILGDVSLENKLTKDLSEEELITLRDEVSKYMIEGDLKRFNRLAIERLREIRCYHGIYHEHGLPCRDQHTKNNCHTLKGKRVAVAGKKAR